MTEADQVLALHCWLVDECGFVFVAERDRYEHPGLEVSVVRALLTDSVAKKQVRDFYRAVMEAVRRARLRRGDDFGEADFGNLPGA